MTPGLGIDDILAALTADPSVQDLFGGKEALRQMQVKAQVQGEARQRLAEAVLAVFESPAGQIVFDYLVGAYVRAWMNVSAMGLPMETAIQLHAVRDGQVGVVHDLLRLVKEAQNPKTATTSEA